MIPIHPVTLGLGLGLILFLFLITSYCLHLVGRQRQVLDVIHRYVQHALTVQDRKVHTVTCRTIELLTRRGKI